MEGLRSNAPLFIGQGQRRLLNAIKGQPAFLRVQLSPTLTSIDLRAEAIGHRAVDQLLWRLAHPNETHDIQILVEPTLHSGESVATL